MKATLAVVGTLLVGSACGLFNVNVTKCVNGSAAPLVYASTYNLSGVYVCGNRAPKGCAARCPYGTDRALPCFHVA